MKDEALRMALEALKEMLAAERATNRPPETVMQAEQKLDRIRKAAKQSENAITAIEQVLANDALDRMADNERELGIQMQPEPPCKTGSQCTSKCDGCAEPELVAWGVDWGNAGDSPCVSIIKRLPDGVIEVVAVEYGPQRKPLTDEEIEECFQQAAGADDEVHIRFARAIEAAHGIKE